VIVCPRCRRPAEIPGGRLPARAARRLGGFDALTQFREKDHRYLFSRLRRPQPTPDMSEK
jgi:hypothetical protein